MLKLERIRVPRRTQSSPSRRRRSLALAGAILALGLAASAGAALWWRAGVRDERRRAFDTTAADVTATLRTMLGRDADFVATLRAAATMEPEMSPTRFDRWFVALQGRARQTGMLGTAILRSLPAGEVVAFQRRRNADPAFRAFVDGHTLVAAPDGRARMCLPAVGAEVRTPLAPVLAEDLQEDWCDPRSTLGEAEAGALRAQAETGQLRVSPLTEPGISTTLLQAAFYRHGAPLATAAQRRAAVAGWVSSSFDLLGALRAARGEQDSLGLAVYHRNLQGAMQPIASLGPPARPGLATRRTTFDIEGRWSVLVVQSPGAIPGVSPDVQGALTFLVGALLSGLLAAIVLLIWRSRERALALVREKTGELRHRALHDTLTNLPNRRLALERLELMLERARRSGSPVAALYVDLDGFKHVNDSLGHAAGDELLRAVASRLEAVVRSGDVAARLSGDEFVVLLDESARSIGAAAIAERVLTVLRQPYSLSARFGSRRLSLTASIGMALATGGTAEELLHNADLALYEAKESGRDRWVPFDARMRTASQERLELELDLAEALQRDELFLLYQPTLDLLSETIVGAEALIRWRHPTRGLIGPDRFIPIAEQSGAIVKIGRWALEQACRQAAAWAREGSPIGVAVNVSTRQLEDDALIADVRGALRQSGLAPQLLTLEITETALMRDAQTSVERLSALKRLGVRIAVDDFGTGYSSLAYLRQFPVDLLKIDRSFVAGVVTSKESAALIDTLVRLADLLGIRTVAEGIEDRDQLRALRRARCAYGQGYLFARPLDAGALGALLAGAERCAPEGSADLPRSFPSGERVEDPMAHV